MHSNFPPPVSCILLIINNYLTFNLFARHLRGTAVVFLPNTTAIMEASQMFAVIKKSKLVHLCFAISFFTSGLIINVAQAVLFYGLKPLNKKLYRSINYYLCYSYFSRKWLPFDNYYVTINTRRDPFQRSFVWPTGGPTRSCTSTSIRRCCATAACSRTRCC